MSAYDFHPIDLAQISTYPLDSRHSKVTVRDFAHPLNNEEAKAASGLLSSLPNILAVQSLRAVAEAVVQAKTHHKAIIWGAGGHVIKTGLAPIIIDLMRRGFVTALALNGSGVIHDFEIALIGSTSEDVDEALGQGAFGMAEETGRMLNDAIKQGARAGIGLGEAVGRMLVETQPPFAEYSLLHEAYQRKIPVTVHATIGTDIIHLHPNADGASIGQTSHQDFRLLTSLVKELDSGGVYLNIGSAVTLPEIFLKAVTVVRNLGVPLQNFTTANFDFIQHYRPNTNVVKRPVANGAGNGYSLTGHHELMIPLLAAAIISAELS
jgi:deoxyhypusine synthase